MMAILIHKVNPNVKKLWPSKANQINDITWKPRKQTRYVHVAQNFLRHKANRTWNLIKTTYPNRHVNAIDLLAIKHYCCNHKKKFIHIICKICNQFIDGKQYRVSRNYIQLLGQILSFVPPNFFTVSTNKSKQ